MKKPMIKQMALLKRLRRKTKLLQMVKVKSISKPSQVLRIKRRRHLRQKSKRTMPRLKVMKLKMNKRPLKVRQRSCRRRLKS